MNEPVKRNVHKATSDSAKNAGQAPHPGENRSAPHSKKSEGGQHSKSRSSAEDVGQGASRNHSKSHDGATKKEQNS